MKQTRCVALLVGIIMLGSVLLPIGNVKAVATQNIQIKNRGTMSFFRYEGNLVGQKYLMHEQDGNYHPVYRISTESENSPENIQVDVGNTVMDKKIYQMIQGGFPYKSASSLGCSSDFYAYVATQTAIDCYVRGYELEKLEPVSSEAEIMKQAVFTIFENSKEVSGQRPKLSIGVQPVEDWQWIEDREVRRDYQVTCNYEDAHYTVSTTNEAIQIRDTQDEEKTVFSMNEPMRLVATKEDLTQDISWSTTVKMEKEIQDIYQSVNSDNGRVYALCGYRFTQKAEASFEEMLEAYKEEPAEPVEPENPEVPGDIPVQKPTQEEDKNTEENMQNTNDIGQDTNETDMAKVFGHDSLYKHLPRTGF